MLRGSSGIKEQASGLQKPAGASSNCFALGDVRCRADVCTNLVRKQVLVTGNDITLFT